MRCGDCLDLTDNGAGVVRLQHVSREARTFALLGIQAEREGRQEGVGGQSLVADEFGF